MVTGVKGQDLNSGDFKISYFELSLVNGDKANKYIFIIICKGNFLTIKLHSVLRTFKLIQEKEKPNFYIHSLKLYLF